MALLRRATRRNAEYYSSPPRSPVPRRRTQPMHYDDAFSPNGRHTHKLGLPDEFRMTEECYDSTLQGGRKLYKRVQAMQWSREWGLAGKRIEEITLPVFARSVRERQVLDQFQRELRSRHVDIESAAIQWAQHELYCAALALPGRPVRKRTKPSQSL